MSKTINLAPTWVAATRAYCEVLKNSTNAEAKLRAEEDMMRLARSFDLTQTDEHRAAMAAVLQAASDYAELCCATGRLKDIEVAGIMLSVDHLKGE